jgi:hypothetical protein
MKHIERRCKMINMAVKLDWLAKDPFASFKKHFEKVEQEPLNGKELISIANNRFYH